VLLSPRWRFPSTAVTGLFEGFVWRKDSSWWKRPWRGERSEASVKVLRTVKVACNGESRIATVKATAWRRKSRCDGERSEASVKAT
jgi:hypothetical protein